MDVDIVEQVENWESEPFSGGYAGLHDLSDRSFTGAVETGGTYLFMLNGRAIGVFDLPPVGSPAAPIEAFEDATGTVYEAPHPSLPLLFTMLVSDGETRGQYYTEDTPIEEVDGQLSEGGFTGYIELSENVLSGDYYVVYQAGRSMSAAFVGASSRLHTDEEAFERASDEVGIYDVVAVDIDVIDVPEPASGAASDPDTGLDAAGAVAAGSAATSDEDSDGADAESDAEPERGTDADVTESSAAASDADATASPTDSGASDADASPEQAADSAGAEERERPAGRPDDELTDATERVDESDNEPDWDADSPTRDTTGAAASPTHDTNGSRSEGTASGDATDAEADTSAEPASRSGETELAVKAIPSLDPERSGGDSDASEARMAGIDARDRRGRTQSGARDDTGGTESAAGRGAAASDTGGTTDEPPASGPGAGATDDLESLRSALAEREERIDDLEAEIASATDEREELREERDRLREERDDLEATVQELRGRVRELEAETAGGASADELERAEALEGTDLFVRYRSKSDPTLAAVADGAARDDVVANLRLERHTRFEAADATVAGQPYDTFIETTLASRFVRWVVEDLPYEIRDTGHTASLRDLYDVLPDVDRAELRGSVSVETEDGTDERSFDIVLRDRMGDPLAVADLDTSRQPTGGGPMRSLIEDATTVAEGTESLAAAFFVTSSFFESDALETARNETGTGLLSRDKRASVVKLSRKQGYHLCLVEARDESFHLTVPEL